MYQANPNVAPPPVVDRCFHKKKGEVRSISMDECMGGAEKGANRHSWTSRDLVPGFQKSSRDRVEFNAETAWPPGSFVHARPATINTKQSESG
jgi:hypothetical protein